MNKSDKSGASRQEPVVVTESADRVTIRLNRPEARNAINAATVHLLHEACERLERDPKVALFLGTDGIFAAGADIGELKERRAGDALIGINSRIFDRIHRLPMPTIALVDGYALGGGAELAYACDFRIGTPGVRFGNPEPSLGIIAAAGGTWRLRELVGEAIAKEVLLAGRMLHAEEALKYHLLNEIVPPDELEDAGQRLADRVTAQASLAVRLTKQAFHSPREAHPVIDNLAQAILFESDKKHALMTKFLERRKG